MNQNRLRTYRDAVVVITGGASGIGRALALDLASRGAEVVVADLQLDVAKDLVESIRGSGGRADAVELDVTDYDAVEHLVQETKTRRGRLDYMFNNAGISHGMGAGARHYKIEDWRRIVDVNLMGIINGVQASYPLMVEQGFGHIVNTASMAGLVPSPGTTSYVTTKHAVVGLSHNLRAEGAQLGIRATVLCPGVIDTPFLEGGKYGRHVTETTNDQYRAVWAKHKAMAPSDFARVALDSVAKNKGIVIAPSSWKVFWGLFRLAPEYTLRMGSKVYKDTMAS